MKADLFRWNLQDFCRAGEPGISAITWVHLKKALDSISAFLFQWSCLFGSWSIRLGFNQEQFQTSPQNVQIWVPTSRLQKCSWPKKPVGLFQRFGVGWGRPPVVYSQAFDSQEEAAQKSYVTLYSTDALEFPSCHCPQGWIFSATLFLDDLLTINSIFAYRAQQYCGMCSCNTFSVISLLEFAKKNMDHHFGVSERNYRGLVFLELFYVARWLQFASVSRGFHRPSSHRTRSTSQQARVNFRTHNSRAMGVFTQLASDIKGFARKLSAYASCVNGA